MSGHNKWSQLKHQKGITDKKRGASFSKLLAAISVAAKTEQNPDFNPRLRTAIEKAKASQVPIETIERAVKRASESAGGIEELTLEVYGPGGTAILIEATTDNRNRTVAEVKHLIVEHGGKWAEPGSVAWAFELILKEGGWTAKFPQKLSETEREKLNTLIKTIEEHGDVQCVFTNAA